MRLRYGFHAGQNPARVNAASPDACAALRAVSTHGVDLRRLSRRCLTAFVVPRRSTPCVDAFCGDNRHAAMRLWYGFNAGQNPARVNAASPDTCAALRAVSTHGVDLRDCYVAGRCADGYVAAKPRPGFRDTPIETRMGVSRIDTRIVTSPIKMPMVGSPLNAPMVMSPINPPTVTSPISMPSAAWPINTPVAHRSPACNLGKAQ
jgi:hypothetical protein